MAVDREMQATVLMMKGVISELPEEQQKEIKDSVAFLEMWINEKPETKQLRFMALTTTLLDFLNET